MIGSIRTIVIAAGAVGAVGTATYVGVNAPSSQSDQLKSAAADNFELCLRSDLRLFESAPSGCLRRADIAALRDAPLADNNARSLSVTLSHPNDSTMAPAEVRNCRDYQEKRWDGWYASSGRDMRRDAYFVRACGLLEMLMRAGPAAYSYIAEAGLTAADYEALGADKLLRLGADPAVSETDGVDAAAAPQPETTGARWRLTVNGQVSQVQELALADFDGDEIAEMLVFLTNAPVGGSASLSAVALVEKDADTASAHLTVLNFDEKSRSVGGAR